jgi:HEAT repeat protein
MKRSGRPRIRRWTNERLVRLALAHGTASRGWDAIAQLHRRGSPAVFAQVESLVRSASARRRALGLDIAAQLRHPASASDGLGEPYAPAATQVLLQAALADRHPGVLQSAITGLGHRPVPAALQSLLAHLDHPDTRVRFALAYALGSYPDPDAAAALMRLAADRDDDVRDWATFSLGTLSDADDDAVRTRLWTNAHDPNRDVRGEAVVGLARRSDPRVIELLKQRLADDDCRIYELEAAEEMPRAELLETLRHVRAEAEQRRGLDPLWHRHLLDAIDACELVADA